MKSIRAFVVCCCMLMVVGSALAQYWEEDEGNVYSVFSGNLGVGTNSPEEKLHVKGDVQIEAPPRIILADIEIPNIGKITYCYPVWTRLVSGLGCDAGIAMTSSGTGVNTWQILRDGGTSNLMIKEAMPYEPFSIDAFTMESGTGNVGIHETDPVSPLHVTKEGPGSQVVATFSNPAENEGAEVEIQMAAGTSTGLPPWTWYLNAANGSFSIGSTNVMPATLNLTSSGHLGVGVASPMYGLHLPNSSYAEGAVLASTYMSYSSKRFKTNISPIENALDKVQQLTGVSFDWKNQGKHDIGLIAEDVGQVIPEVVDYEANGIDATSIDYSKLVALLIEAVKEQQARINELEQAVANTKQLEQRIEALERLIQQQQMPCAR